MCAGTYLNTYNVYMVYSMVVCIYVIGSTISDELSATKVRLG